MSEKTAFSTLQALATDLKDHEQRLMANYPTGQFVLGVGRQLRTPDGRPYGLYGRGTPAEAAVSGTIACDAVARRRVGTQQYEGASLGVLSLTFSEAGVHSGVYALRDRGAAYGLEAYDDAAQLCQLFAPLGSWLLDIVDRDMTHQAMLDEERRRITEDDDARLAYARALQDDTPHILKDPLPIHVPTIPAVEALSDFYRHKSNVTLFAGYTSQPNILALQPRPESLA